MPRRPSWKAAWTVVGRRHELEAVSRLLDEGGVLCLEGRPGIGKTTLWRAGVALSRERGFRVLAATPAEAERSLSYAVLADLLEPVADEVFPSLPDPQRRALERVLLVAADDEPLDLRLVGAAVRTSLAVLEGRVLVALDDVQWLDAASATALAFALRRSAVCCTPHYRRNKQHDCFWSNLKRGVCARIRAFAQRSAPRCRALRAASRASRARPFRASF